MRAGRSQTTLTGPCTVSGRGYWSGEPITLTFLPAPVGTGIKFVRADLTRSPSVLAIADYRESMPLRTRLSDGAAEVDMVEHVMAALHGMGVDNCEVHATSAEMPGMDGSSLAYALAIDGVGQVQLRGKKNTFKIRETVRVGTKDQWVQIEPTDGEKLEVEYRLDYGLKSPIGKSVFSSVVDDHHFYHEIAPARTFISQADARALQSQGLARHVTERDLLVFDEHGPVNNKLRFSDECARHKALDLIGDLALTGLDLIGRVVAYRSGHQLNGQLAELLREMYFDQRSVARAA